ncbi:hypothetical protein FACS189427_12280 [Planctomycetales bacterium]|nr:hypothetical protein FACS189427_12280 [Planctomycetales bacterium]
MKLPKLNVGNYRAMQNQIIKAALESAGTGVQVNMPSEQKISDYIDKELKVPPEDKKAILDAIKKGDTATLQTLLGNIGTTGQQLSNLMGLAKVNDALKNGGKIPTSVLIDLTKNGAPGIVSPALFSALQTYGKVQKINGLFSIAINLLNGGGSLSGQNIPTGLVPVVTMPGVPYGVVFPLGNGVWGMGIGGNVGLYAQPGLYQGYLPQPPVYSSNYVCPTNEGAAPYIFFNKTDTDIEYRFDDNSRILKLKKGYTDIGDLSSAPVEVELRKAGTSLWSSDSADTGAYKIIDSVDNTIGLEKTPTKITLKSPGNPIPFTLYANGTKFTIEPGKPLELTLPSNEVIRIQFARSSDKTDVAKHIVGGTRSFDIGIDKSTGKYALVPGKTATLKPPKPQQSLTASSEIAYDDTKITESNFEGLPVIPDYGN